MNRPAVCASLAENVLTVHLPLPPLAIRPNGRGHYHKVAKAKKEARRLARLVALGGGPFGPVARASYRLAYRFPRTLWDEDNCIGAVKAYLDGIADALRCDDRHFRFGGLSRERDPAAAGVTITVELA